MPLPSCVVQVSAPSGGGEGSTSVFASPLTAGNKVIVMISGSGAPGSPAATIHDDCGSTFVIDAGERNLTTSAALILSGNVAENSTNSSSTITLTGLNFTPEVWVCVEILADSRTALAVAAATAGGSASSLSNALGPYDSDGVGSFIATSAFAGNLTANFSATGSPVEDQTELYNNNPGGGDVAISVCATDGADDPSTAPTIVLTLGSSTSRPSMVSAAYKLPAAAATSFTATARQSGVNKNQKGYAAIAPSPADSGFDVPTTIIANCTNGTSNFIRQSDGVQSVGSVTLSGTETAVMEVFSTQSSASIVFSWTTNNASITSPAATSFTVQAVESAFVAATPSILWNYSVANSGFLTTPAAASTVAHGTGFSQIVIAAAGTRVWGEYITDTRRTICIPAATPDPSDVSKHEIYLENSTPVTAYNIKIYEDETNVFGAGFEFPDVTGVYVWYDRITPFNGKERLAGGLFFYDNDGTLPKITSTITDLAGFFAAFSTDPVNRVSLNTIPENTTITLSFTTSTDTLAIPGSWTSSMPFVIKGASRTTSIIQSESPNWYSKFESALSVPSITFENLTYVPTNIGQFYASAASSLIFKDCDILEALEEFSKNFGVTTGSQWACPNGVFFINCKVRAVSCSGVAGFRASGDGLKNLIPDAVVGFDFFQCAYTGFVFSTYAKRISTDNTMAADALTYLTIASSTFNVGTNSNLTKIIVTDMPQTSGYEWLTYSESVQLLGENYPVVIGRTDVANGILYAAGDLTGGMTAGTTITVSAAFQTRLHYVNTLVVTGATNNHDGTATITWADSSQPEGVTFYENMQFATTTTTVALRGLRFSRNAIPSGRSVTVNGELAGSAVAGDLIWFMQEAHADANQIGLQGGQGQNPGPIMEMNYLNEGFQTGLFQPGASYTISGFAMINVISVGVQFQLQQQSQNIVFQNTTTLNNILQSTFTSGVDFYVNDSIAASTSATSPTDWNNGVLFTNSHGIDETLPNGIGNTTGAITYDAYYNSTTSALQSRVWNTNVAFDLYGNEATTNGSTYSRIGAVLGDPTSDSPIIPGTLVLLSQTITQAVFQFGSANGLAVTMTFQSSTSNGVAWADLISLPNQDFSGVQYATDAPPLGQTWIFREEFTNATDTEYSNTLTLNGLAPLFAGTISHVTSGLLLGMV